MTSPTDITTPPAKLLLLDRDGVINHDSPDYIKRPEEWHAIPGSLEAIAAAQQSGITVAICTNQSGVARGYFDLDTLHDIHAKLNAELTALGGRTVDIHFCPHGPDDGCACRKPKPGLLSQAMATANVRASETVYVGDSKKDVEAAFAAGCGSALVLTGNGQESLAALTELPAERQPPFTVHADLAEAVKRLG